MLCRSNVIYRFASSEPNHFILYLTDMFCTVLQCISIHEINFSSTSELLQDGTVQYSTVQYSTVQYSTVQYSAVKLVTTI